MSVTLRLPSIENSTFVTAMSSLAEAEIVADGPFTVEPSVGLVILTTGAVVSTTGGGGGVWVYTT